MSLSVLVADDSKLSRRSVIRSLPQDLEYDISEFGLILLDLTMPEVDGVGVLEFLHARPNMPNVIVISADFQPEKQKIVMSLGAKRFLRKPLDKEELAMALFELGYL